jgi:hypothetical protein
MTWTAEHEAAYREKQRAIETTREAIRSDALELLELRVPPRDVLRALVHAINPRDLDGVMVQFREYAVRFLARVERAADGGL